MQLVDHFQLSTTNNVIPSKLVNSKVRDKNTKPAIRNRNEDKHEDSITEPGIQHIFISPADLMDFRTRQCPDYQRGVCKDSMKCWNSHSETWPRRSPLIFNYDYKLCSNINFIKSLDKMQLQGKCKYGRKCRYSHSKEEQLYHPLLYKTRLCLNYPNCKSYYCPFAHCAAELRHTTTATTTTNNKCSNNSTGNFLAGNSTNDGMAGNKLKVSFQPFTPSTASAITSPPSSPRLIKLLPNCAKQSINLTQTNNTILSSDILKKSTAENACNNNVTLDMLDQRLNRAFEVLRLNENNNNESHDRNELTCKGDAANLNLSQEPFIPISQWFTESTNVLDSNLHYEEDFNFYETIRAGREMHSTWGPYSENYFDFNNNGGCVGDKKNCLDEFESLDNEIVDDKWLNGVVQTGLDMAKADANRFLTTLIVHSPQNNSNFDDFCDFEQQNNNNCGMFEDFYSDGFNISSSAKDCMNENVTRKDVGNQTVAYPPGFLGF